MFREQLTGPNEQLTGPKGSRKAAVLQPPGAEDALSALLLAASEPSRLTHTAPRASSVGGR